MPDYLPATGFLEGNGEVIYKVFEKCLCPTYCLLPEISFNQIPIK